MSSLHYIMKNNVGRTMTQLVHSSRYSALAGERKHSAPGKVSVGEPRRQEPRSPVSGGRRQGAVYTQEREKALEAVRAETQPKVWIT